MEEQIEVLRLLFTRESVTFDGRWHHIEAAGLKPLPVQQPIPIWLGGSVDATLRRVAALGDGWFPQMPPERAREAIERLHAYAREAGRDPSSIGIEGRLSIAGTNEEDWARTVEEWQALEATHLTVNTMGAGLATPQDHIDAIRTFREAIAGVV
jgi:alkanesulfonate monooxygenase SsuD/methylene tetrahydromethanopterin reductase-like flavin-dependent oxidoreductase (luciferase family)